MTAENKEIKVQPTTTTPVVQEKSITDAVLRRINQYQANGELKLPDNYSAENALKSAYLTLLETVDRDKNPVLTSCTKESIANSLLDMVVQGLSPMKKQCYFIAYGKKLQLSRSYQGSVAIAKRVGLKCVVANVIYEGDEFEYEINTETGRKHLIKHDQKIENIDLKKIRGAYAITELTDGTKDLELMNINQIHNAWNQGAAKGASGAHINFTDEMCKKTVIQRAMKSVINSSDDSHLHTDENEESPLKMEISESANKEEIGFTDAVEIQEEPKPEPVKEKKIKEPETKQDPGKDLFDKTEKKAPF